MTQAVVSKLVTRPARVLSGRHFREEIEVSIPEELLSTSGRFLTLHVELWPEPDASADRLPER